MNDERAFKNYRDLIAWQKAMDLAAMVYQMSHTFPKEEQYGLTSQIRRAVVSVPSNIAEGHARRSTKEFIHFLSVAHGSLAEIETQFLLAERLNYLSKAESLDVIKRTSEVGRLINGLIKSLKPSNN
jgi:four helix bundle protein